MDSYKFSIVPADSSMRCVFIKYVEQSKNVDVNEFYSILWTFRRPGKILFIIIIASLTFQRHGHAAVHTLVIAVVVVTRILR